MYKVLHIVGHLGKGGDSTAIFNVMDYLKNNEVNIKFDFLTHEGYDENTIKILAKHHNIYILKKDARKTNPLKYYYEVKKILKENQYHAIHFHTSFQSCIGIIAAKRCGMKKIVCHSHTSDVQRRTNKIAKKVLLPICQKIINSLATDKVACSEIAGKNLFGNKSFKVIYNGISINKFKKVDSIKIEEIKRKVNYKENDIIIGQVGRFSDMKNQEFTIQLAKLYPKYKFIFLGNGENYNKIQRIVYKEQISNVYLMNKVNNVADYMSIFDFLLMPSKYGEGLPVTLIEQQLANPKCLCIANDNISKESNLGRVEFESINNIEKWGDLIEKNMKKVEAQIDYKKFDINYSAKEWIGLYENRCSK